MSKKSDVLVNPVTGVREQTWTGISWPCLLFGVLWFLYKRLYGWAAITFLVAVGTGGFAWLIFPFFANSVHRTSFEKAGWRPEHVSGEALATPESLVRCPECRELVRNDARLCKHCRSTLVPVA